jgi:pyrroloquinoline quinone (PQQ) biosynthesis protein C
MSPAELEAALRAIGAERYHNRHPLHVTMREGRCTKTQIRAWALNRYAYQATIPIKDATILARMDDPALRREWRRRILDHDGDGENEGGVHRWLKLTEGLGLDRDLVVSRESLAYFTARPEQARRDSDFALDYVKRQATTPETQRAALDALIFKCDLLWAMSDALTHAYVEGHIPPGAWRPEAS